MKPRFVAAGGDPGYLARVVVESPKPGQPPRELDLARYVSFFRVAIEGATLVVVDPLLGQMNTRWDADKAQHARQFMRPLDAAVRDVGAALLAGRSQPRRRAQCRARVGMRRVTID